MAAHDSRPLLITSPGRLSEASAEDGKANESFHEEGTFQRSSGAVTLLFIH